MKPNDTTEYECHECCDGLVQCCECGNDKTCEVCDGSSLNPKLVDIHAWREAETAAWKKHGGCAWGIRGPNGNPIGRAGGPDTGAEAWRLYYADFPAKGATK